MNDNTKITEPANMSSVKQGIITATDIYNELHIGNTTLYEKRFGFGRANDYNEFSASLEEREMLPIIPYNNGIAELCNISLNNSEVFDAIAKSRADDKKNDSRFIDEPSIEERSLLKGELLLSYMYDINDSTKYESRTNINIIDVITHQQMFDDQEFTYRTKFNDSVYISLNEITLLDNAYTSNRNLTKLNRTRRLGELLNLITSNTLSGLRKEQRPQLYYTSNGIRPDNTQYHTWNGLQVFDLDLKYADNFETINVKETKRLLYESLKHYSWFVGAGVSSSGKGIHIYTKVTRPHHYYVDEKHNESYIKYWYRMSYVQKYAAIRYIMENICNVDNGYDPRHPVIDFAVGKISQGIRVSFDKSFLINPNFEDIQPCVNYHVPPVQDLKLEDWLLVDYITDNKIFKQWEKDNQDAYDILNGTYIQPVEYTFDDTEVTLDNPQLLKPFNGEIHYQLRYNVCNTLACFFGEQGREYAHTILKSTDCRNVNEINGIYNCSLTTKKNPSKYGLQVIGSCGFNVKIGDATSTALINDTKQDLMSLIARASTSNDMESKCALNLKPDEYLGNYTDMLLSNFKAGKTNLLVSPPGTGKTELVKSLSSKYRVLLVLPYISVIDAKVVRDNDLGDAFDAYFGSTSVADIKKGKSAVMTLDKFGRIDVDKIAYMYDYIMIDESHLIFTSSFRLEAMANSLKNIKYLTSMSGLDEYSARVVMMTGTPTGENAYFNFYDTLNEILVRKEEERTKKVEFVICSDVKDMQAKIAIHIANSLQNKKKILYPTNAGDVQAAKLIGMIEHQLGRSIKWSYYKKSNSNSEMATKINEFATVGDYELILASNYLSVGIDIKDMSDFECIYDSSFAGYEIEQFNCRLRQVDIVSKIYIPLHDANGDMMKNLLNYSNYSIKMNREDRDVLRDYNDISKKKLELSVSYDPITNRIFTPGFRIENGQIVFKLEEHELISFEERFLETMRSPYFIALQLAEYGYEIMITDSDVIDQNLTAELIRVGLTNAKLESQIKNDIAVYTFGWLMDNDNYKNSYDMEYPNLVNRIWKESIEVVEDPKNSEISVEESMIGEVVKIIVPDRRIFDDQLSIASRFLSLYSIPTCRYIHEQCIRKSGKINKAEVSRYMRLMQLVKMEERGNLGPEINELIQFMYTYIDDFNTNTDYWVSTDEHELRVDYCTQLYLDKLGLSLRSIKMTKKYRQEVSELINVLCCKSKYEDGLRLEFRILPTPDNATRLKLKQYDSILKQMFDISDNRLPELLQDNIRTRHLPQQDINSIESIKRVRTGDVSELLMDVKPF